MYIPSDNQPVLASFRHPYTSAITVLLVDFSVCDGVVMLTFQAGEVTVKELWSQHREQTWQLDGSGAGRKLIISKITVTLCLCVFVLTR